MDGEGGEDDVDGVGALDDADGLGDVVVDEEDGDHRDDLPRGEVDVGVAGDVHRGGLLLDVVVSVACDADAVVFRGDLVDDCTGYLRLDSSRFPAPPFCLAKCLDCQD